MSGDAVLPASADDAAPAEPAASAVRPTPPVFATEHDGAQVSAPPSIRPAPTDPPTPPPAPFAPPVALAPAVPAAGLAETVDKTVVTPRPTDDDLDSTVIVPRRRGVQRFLVLDDDRRFALSGASVVIGRNPVGEPGEQRLAVADTTRTLSKTHARLVVDGDEWRLTDLHSTNGVVVAAEDGTETLLDPGESVIGTGRFILGEVGMHVVAENNS